MNKRFITLLLVLLLLPYATIAHEDPPVAWGDWLYYSPGGYSDLPAQITKYLGHETDVIVPSKVKIYRVGEIGDYVFNRDSGICSITLPENMKWISERAFWEINSLEKIILPRSTLNAALKSIQKCPVSVEAIIINEDGSRELLDRPFYKEA